MTFFVKNTKKPSHYCNIFEKIILLLLGIDHINAQVYFNKQ